MADDKEPTPENNDIEVLAAFNVVIANFKPCQEITDDSMTTAEVLEIVGSHVGFVLPRQIYLLMKDAGFKSQFSYARKELVWLMELK